MTEYRKYRTVHKESSGNFDVYSNKYITVSGGSSQYSLKENTTLFDSMVVAGYANITVSGSNTVQFSINDTGADLIETNSMEINNFYIYDLFITSEVENNLTVRLYGWK